MNLSTAKILLSIPHCSSSLTQELQGRVRFSELAIKQETDLFTDQLFDFDGVPTLKTAFSRYVVDLNRSRDSGGEKGVIVTTDFDNRPIYQEGETPTPQEREERLKKYWDPYHRQMEQQLTSPSIRLFMDAHSMRPVGSAKAPDTGEERADIVLSNLGTTTGKIRPEIGYLSCPWEWLLMAAEILEDLWRPHPVEIAFNDPYFGGYITQHYSDPQWPGHKPGMQIEVNRKLYLNWETQEPLPRRIQQLNQTFREFLRRFDRLLLGNSPRTGTVP